MSEDLRKEQANQQQPVNNHNNTLGSGISSDSTPANSENVAFAHNDYPFIHAEHGVLIDQQSPQNAAEEAEYEAHHNLWWTRMRHHLKDPFAEFMGTFVMIVFGDGAVAQVMLSANKNLPAGDQNKGDYQSISWYVSLMQSLVFLFFVIDQMVFVASRHLLDVSMYCAVNLRRQ